MNNLSGIVILTRQNEFIENLHAQLAQLNYRPVAVPASTVVVCAGTEHILQSASSYDDLIFVSRNAVRAALPHISIGLRQRLFAVGKESAREITRFAQRVHYPEQGNGARELLKMDVLQQISARKILILRGETGLDILAAELTRRGAEVDNVILYKTIEPMRSRDLLQQLLGQQEMIYAIFFHSGEAARRFVSWIPDNHTTVLAQTIAVAGSSRIQNILRETGWQSQIRVAQSPKNSHMLQALLAVDH